MITLRTLSKNPATMLENLHSEIVYSVGTLVNSLIRAPGQLPTSVCSHTRKPTGLSHAKEPSKASSLSHHLNAND